VILDVFKRRHAVRSFQKRAISFELLSEILEAVNSAPSAGGLKARETHVIADRKIKQQLARAAFGQDFVAQAPVVLVFWAVPSRSAAKYGARGRDLFCVQDATIAASFAWIQAVGLGLAGCWVGAFDESAVKEIFQNEIKADWRPIALLPIGYAAE
jgi:nitroreductase